MDIRICIVTEDYILFFEQCVSLFYVLYKHGQISPANIVDEDQTALDGAV